MKKLFSVICVVALIATMFSTLGCLTAGASETGTVPLTSGKYIKDFNAADWTASQTGCVVDDSKLLAGAIGATPAAGTAGSVTTVNKYDFGNSFNCKFYLKGVPTGNDFKQYNNEYSGVTVGAISFRLCNEKNASTDWNNNGTYYKAIYVNGSLFARTESISGYEMNNGFYTVSYDNGSMSVEFKGHNLMFKLASESDSVGYTHESVSVGNIDLSSAAVNVFVQSNKTTVTENSRYINNFYIYSNANGDTNATGSLDSTDVLNIKQALLGIRTTDVSNVLNCDVNYSDSVESADYLAMKMKVLGKSELDGYDSKPVRIMCIGDSITAGTGALSGWRYSFYNDMYSTGANFELVGYYNSYQDSRLPEQYQGFCAVGGDRIGYTTTDEATIEAEKTDFTTYSGSKSSLSKYDNYEKRSAYGRSDEYMGVGFDAVCIKLGYNDFAFNNVNQSSIDGNTVYEKKANFTENVSLYYYKKLIEKIHATNPEAKIYVSTMALPSSSIGGTTARESWRNGTSYYWDGALGKMTYAADSDGNALITNINGRLAQIQSELSAEGIDITLVDNNDINSIDSEWVSDDYPTFDGVHPFESGLKHMGIAFSRAVAPDVKAANASGEKVFTPDNGNRVQSVTTDKSDVSVEVGSAELVTATVLPSTAKIDTVVYTSADPSIATVSETSGRITGVAPGTTSVTATSLDGGKTSTINVTVTASTEAAKTELLNDGFANLNNWDISAYSSSNFYVWNETPVYTALDASAASKIALCRNGRSFCTGVSSTKYGQFTTASSYDVSNGFDVSCNLGYMQYAGNGNMGGYNLKGSVYFSMEFAGVEVRAYDACSTFVLFNHNKADDTSNVYNIDGNVAVIKTKLDTIANRTLEMKYRNGVLSVIYEGVTVYSTSMNIDAATLASAKMTIKSTSTNPSFDDARICAYN